MARTAETTETIDAHAAKGSHNGRGSHTNDKAEESDDRGLQDRAADALRMAPGAARHTAATVADHAPEVLNASTNAISEATRRIQGSSDQQLTGWAAFALGLWAGLMLGRVPRVVSVVAGLPAVVLAGALVARHGGIGAAKR